MKTNKQWKAVSVSALGLVRGGDVVVSDRVRNTNTSFEEKPIFIGDGGTGGKVVGGGPPIGPTGDGATTTYVVR